MRGELLGAGTGGVWTAAQARAAGVSSSTVARALASGGWQSLGRGVYLDGGVVAGPRHRAWAAVLAAGGPGRAVAVGRTAARVHGLPLVDDDDPATRRHEHLLDDVAVARGLHARAGLHVHRWSYAAQELGTVGRCPVPSLARTLWDLRQVLRPDALVCALDAALHAQRVDLPALQAQVRPRSRGAAGFRSALALADGRAESPLETLTRLVLLPVLPGLEPQVTVRDRDGRLRRVDLGHRDLRLGVEADGGTHRGAVSLAADRQREARTGWTFERVVWRDVRVEPEALQTRVLATAARLRAR